MGWIPLALGVLLPGPWKALKKGFSPSMILKESICLSATRMPYPGWWSELGSATAWATCWQKGQSGLRPNSVEIQSNGPCTPRGLNYPVAIPEELKAKLYGLQLACKHNLMTVIPAGSWTWIHHPM